MKNFGHALLRWHKDNPRPLPWSSGKRDPYHIWLSEIIMQQTRIEQGTAYYLRFVEKYPTVQHFAAAPIDEVMLLWEGLGYYTRARNLHKAAKQIVNQHHGLVPNSYDDLLSLPGIGPYSAAAIASFAFDLPHVVVDGNVKRLISRFAGIKEAIDIPAIHKRIHSIASDLLNGHAPAVFNQAIMNFGSLVCKPKPVCTDCPLSTNCHAHKNNLASELPVRTTKKENRHRYFHFVVLHFRGKFLLQRREQDDIWKGLYAPLLIEQKSMRSPTQLKLKDLIESHTGCSDFKLIESSVPFQQILSHQTIHAKFHHVQLKSTPKNIDDSLSVWTTKKTAAALGKPKMVVQLFKTTAENCESCREL